MATCSNFFMVDSEVTNGTKLFEMERNGKNKNIKQKWLTWWSFGL